MLCLALVDKYLRVAVQLDGQPAASLGGNRASQVFNSELAFTVLMICCTPSVESPRAMEYVGSPWNRVASCGLVSRFVDQLFIS